MGKKRVRDAEDEEATRTSKDDSKKTRVANFSELSLERLLERERELAAEVRERQQELSDTRRSKAILYGNSEARQMNTRRHRAEYAHAEVQSEIQRRYRAMEEAKELKARAAAEKEVKDFEKRRKAEERATEKAYREAAMQQQLVMGTQPGQQQAVQLLMQTGPGGATMPAAMLQASAMTASAMAQLGSSGIALQLAQQGQLGMGSAGLAGLGMGMVPGMLGGGMGGVGMQAQGMAAGQGMGAGPLAPGLVPFTPGRVPDAAVNLGGLPAAAFPQQVAGGMGGMSAAMHRMPGAGMLGAGLGMQGMNATEHAGVSASLPLAFARR